MLAHTLRKLTIAAVMNNPKLDEDELSLNYRQPDFHLLIRKQTSYALA